MSTLSWVKNYHRKYEFINSLDWRRCRWLFWLLLALSFDIKAMWKVAWTQVVFDAKSFTPSDARKLLSSIKDPSSSELPSSLINNICISEKRFNENEATKVEICMPKWSHFDLIRFSCDVVLRDDTRVESHVHDASCNFHNSSSFESSRTFMIVQVSNTARTPMTPRESSEGFSLQQLPWIKMRWRLSTRINCNFVSFIEHKRKSLQLKNQFRISISVAQENSHQNLAKTNWNSSKACLACREWFLCSFCAIQVPHADAFCFHVLKIFISLNSFGSWESFCKTLRSWRQLMAKCECKKLFHPSFVPSQSSNCELIKITLHETAAES